MLKKHKYVGVGFSDDDIIWKYFSLPAFLAMLENGMLYFTRVSTLPDPNEFPITDLDIKGFGFQKENYVDAINRTKEKSFVNCWRLSDSEDFGMWNAYADAAKGIAIKSDMKRLFAAFDNQQNDNRDIYVGKVAYIDNATERAQKYDDVFNCLFIAFSKTKAYQNECELRLCFEDREIDVNDFGIAVDISVLISEIRVGSSAKPYVKSLIEKIILRYGLNVPVTESIVK